MEELIVLGLIPGTSIQITFNIWLEAVGAFLILRYLGRIMKR
jgi:hypothetical protein